MNIYLPKKIQKLKLIKHKLIKFSIWKRSRINFGFFAVQALDFGSVTVKQLEAGRKFLVRNLTRRSKIWRLVTVTQPLTKKGNLSRMGKGKGKFFGWLGYIRPGTFLYELGYYSGFKRSNYFTKKILKVKSKFSFSVNLKKRSYKLNFKNCNLSFLKK
jgi:large subunit ribosomal protein L16